MSQKTSILITSRNRITDLSFTLQKIAHLLKREDVECIICDDGSTDGTFEMITENFPQITIIRNEKSRGYIFNRNKMLNTTTADYAISLDDDAHFVTDNPIELITDFFDDNPDVGLLGFRVYWSQNEDFNQKTKNIPVRMQSFVGCAHVWRMKSWKDIQDYPEWFTFYGEENFASYELFKKKWEIHYLPQVLVQHRVNIKERKKDQDFGLRLRRSLCSGWSLYFVFLPYTKIPRLMVYTIWIQFKLKVFKGDMIALKSIFLALIDLAIKMPENLKHRNALTLKEYNDYKLLKPAQIYWKPE